MNISVLQQWVNFARGGGGGGGGERGGIGKKNHYDIPV